MIRVTIEMVPEGDEAQKRVIGTASIANVGGTSELGDYVAILADDQGREERLKVRYFRRTSLSAWALLHEVLSSIADRDRRPLFLRKP